MGAQCPLNVSPALACSDDRVGAVHLNALHPQAFRIKVAARRSSFITLARPKEPSVTLSLHYSGFSVGLSKASFSVFVATKGACHEFSLPVDKGWCACFIYGAYLVLNFDDVTVEE